MLAQQRRRLRLGETLAALLRRGNKDGGGGIGISARVGQGRNLSELCCKGADQRVAGAVGAATGTAYPGIWARPGTCLTVAVSQSLL